MKLITLLIAVSHLSFAFVASEENIDQLPGSKIMEFDEPDLDFTEDVCEIESLFLEFL